MATVTSAPPALPLVITDADPHLFRSLRGIQPCMVPISGSSNFQLKPFNVRACGTCTPTEIVTPSLILYAQTAVGTPASIDPNAWVRIASNVRGPSVSPPGQGMWLIDVQSIMYSLVSGTMQGTFQTNVFNTPQEATGFQGQITTIKPNQDPVVVFAVGASASTLTEAHPCTFNLTLFEQYG